MYYEVLQLVPSFLIVIFHVNDLQHISWLTCMFLLWDVASKFTMYLDLRRCNLYQYYDATENRNNLFSFMFWINKSSQKTFPIAIAVIGSLGGVLGEAGLLVLPCLIAHISQVIIRIMYLWKLFSCFPSFHFR